MTTGEFRPSRFVAAFLASLGFLGLDKLYIGKYDWFLGQLAVGIVGWYLIFFPQPPNLWRFSIFISVWVLGSLWFVVTLFISIWREKDPYLYPSNRRYPWSNVHYHVSDIFFAIISGVLLVSILGFLYSRRKNPCHTTPDHNTNSGYQYRR